MSKAKSGAAAMTPILAGLGPVGAAAEAALEPALASEADLDGAYYVAVLRLDLIEIACRSVGSQVAGATALADALVAYVGPLSVNPGRADAEIRLACLQRAADHIARLSLSWDLLATAKAFEAYARGEKVAESGAEAEAPAPAPDASQVQS